MIERVKPFFKEEWLKKYNSKIKDYSYNENYIEAFENKLKKYFNCKYAFLVNSCTSALMLILMSLKLNPNDEVLIPDYGHPAVRNICEFLSIKYKTIDLDPLTLAMDLNLIKQSINKDTKALIHIETNGWLTSSINDLKEICEQNKLIFIEDAAPSFGQRYKEKLAGTFGDISAFSCSMSKTLFGGEGGLIIFNDDKYNIISSFQKANHSFNNLNVEMNFLISPLSSILLEIQFDDLDFILKERKNIYNCYLDNLNVYQTENVSNYYGVVSYFSEKAKLIHEKLKRIQIDSRIFSYPCINQLNNSINIQKCHIDLPSFIGLQEKTIHSICNIIKGV